MINIYIFIYFIMLINRNRGNLIRTIFPVSFGAYAINTAFLEYTVIKTKSAVVNSAIILNF